MRSNFTAMVLKEFKHVLRDQRSLFFLLAQPVMMILLFGFALSNEVKETKIIIVDHARDEVSKSLINRFEQNLYFHIVDILPNENNADEIFKKGIAKLIVVIPANMEDDLKHQYKSTAVSYTHLDVYKRQDYTIPTGFIPDQINLKLFSSKCDELINEIEQSDLNFRLYIRKIPNYHKDVYKRQN